MTLNPLGEYPGESQMTCSVRLTKDTSMDTAIKNDFLLLIYLQMILYSLIFIFNNRIGADTFPNEQKKQLYTTVIFYDEKVKRLRPSICDTGKFNPCTSALK
jgi:hypothetical protein